MKPPDAQKPCNKPPKPKKNVMHSLIECSRLVESRNISCPVSRQSLNVS